MTMSALQQKVLQTFAKNSGRGWCNMGGNKRLHVLSACRALVRKGFAIDGGGSRFAITAEGLEAAKAIKEGV